MEFGLGSPSNHRLETINQIAGLDQGRNTGLYGHDRNYVSFLNGSGGGI